MFSEELRAFADKTGHRLDLVFRTVCLEVSKQIILKTPVDRGRLRGNWQPQIGSPINEPIEVFDKNGGPTVAKVNDVVSKARYTDVFFLSNNLPYAEQIENGSSRQAPQGMLKVTVAEWEEFVRKVTRRVIK